MSIKKLLGAIVVCLIVIGIIALIVSGIQTQQAKFEDSRKAFEAKLPKNVLVQDANEWGYSSGYQITDEKIFFTTLKLYNVTEVWRMHYGDSIKYSFVHDSIIYYYYLYYNNCNN